MFKGIVSAIKAMGRAKAMLEAIDDDVDLDGVSELDELKASFEKLKSLGGEMWKELQAAFKTAMALIDHVAKAGG